jgi:hypothetical protein
MARTFIMIIITLEDVDWCKEPVNTPFASLITHAPYVMRMCSLKLLPDYCQPGLGVRKEIIETQ